MEARGAMVLRAGAAYFAWVFAFAFAFGVVRNVALAPAFGPVVAVVVEVPLVLAVAWWACRRCLRRWPLRGAGERAGMGAAAFLLLVVAELALAEAILPGGAAAFVAGLGRPEGMIGLAGQVGFGVMPLVVRTR